jgi:hypothetical protein
MIIGAHSIIYSTNPDADRDFFRCHGDLGRFQLLDIAVIGAFGTVYKARDPELDRTKAIKVPLASSAASWSRSAPLPQALFHLGRIHFTHPTSY